MLRQFVKSRSLQKDAPKLGREGLIFAVFASVQEARPEVEMYKQSSLLATRSGSCDSRHQVLLLPPGRSHGLQLQRQNESTVSIVSAAAAAAIEDQEERRGSGSVYALGRTHERWTTGCTIANHPRSQTKRSQDVSATLECHARLPTFKNPIRSTFRSSSN